MYKYIVKRIFMMIPVVIGVSFFVFFTLKLAPGDPARMVAGSEADEATVQEIRKDLGLDKPMLEQYLRYMVNLVKGNMGVSFTTGKSVSGEIASRLPYTALLAVSAMLVAVLIALPVGIISATKQYSLMDNVSMLAALIGVSVPNFWLGLMLIILFSLKLGILPSGGNEGLRSLIMPAITLGVGSAANITRTTRSSMLEVIRQDFIRTVRAKGVTEKKVIRLHALRNALIPVVTVFGLQMGTLLGGAVVTETVFSWAGIGRLMVESIKKKDEPIVMGCLIVFAVSFSLVNLLVDILYAYIDPRIKSQYQK
jgi:peptide/nickel transport system permease protein